MILTKNKSIVPNKNITYFLNPDYIYVPAKNIYVKDGEYVYKNQIIADKTSSSVSGKVLGIKKCNIMGKLKNTLVIQNDYREYFKDNNMKMKITIPNMLKILEKDKVLFDKFKSSKTFDNIIVFAINDNPYVYNEVFLLKENINDMLWFYDKLFNLYTCSNNLLVLKNTDAFVIDECLSTLGSYPEIKLSLVNDEYLLENNEVLGKYLKLKGNTLFLSVTELVKIYNLFKGKVSTTKLITISGDVIKENKVLRVKVNTSLKDVTDKYIDINETCDYIINGLMTGFKIDNINNFIITEEVKSINIMKKRNIKESKCIRCGKCISICPCGVNPVSMQNKEKCIDCGLCTYICPCYINLRERLK